MLSGSVQEVILENLFETRTILRRIIQKEKISLNKYRNFLNEKYGINSIEKIGGDRFLSKGSISIDSAFTSSPLYFLGISFAVISAVAIVAGRKIFTKRSKDLLLYSLYSDLPSDYIAERARLLERTLLLDFLYSMNSNIKYVFIDGEIIIPKRQLVFLDKNIMDVTLRLFREARNGGIVVIGIVKRDYSNKISKALGLSTNDKSLLSLLLRRGEYVFYEQRVNSIPLSINCATVYYKPWRGSALFSVRADICNYENGKINEIVAFLSDSTSHTGFPWYIDVVDRHAKTRVKNIVRLLASLVPSESIKDGKEYLGLPSNPQEGSKV